MSVKTIITMPRKPSGSARAWTVRSRTCTSAVGAHLQVPEGDCAFLPQRLLEGVGQLIAQPLPGHGKDVPVCLAGRGLQVLARPPADIEDVAFVVDEHRRRGIPLQEHLVREGLEVEAQVSPSGPAPPRPDRGGTKEEGNSTGSARIPASSRR